MYMKNVIAFCIQCNIDLYFMLSSRISRNTGENIFQSYTGTTSENTDFHVLVATVNCACLTTRWKYDVIYLTCESGMPRRITEKNCTGF